MSGALHPYATMAYAKALVHVGEPVNVPPWGTPVLARDWDGVARDVTGPYPLASLSPDSDLPGGLDQLSRLDYVTVTLVVEDDLGPPIGRYSEAFTTVRPFKTLYIVDNVGNQYSPTSHHRYEIRRAVRNGIDVHVVPLAQVLNEFTALYEILVARHSISTGSRFSRASFEALADCPGLITIAAYHHSALVSCHLWIRQEMRVWSLLAASSPAGYACNAAYALYDQAIRHFAGCSINIGGVAGQVDAADDGLGRFKAGFATGTRQSYLVGSVLQESKYQSICERQSADNDETYFPRYRAPRNTVPT